MPLHPAIRRPLVHARRIACEALGIGRYSWMALNDLDRKIARHLDFDGGVFIEAGANDGVNQSNTYYFERMCGWKGLLVEPVPALAAACRKNRRATVVEAALVANDIPGATVELHVAGLMSTVTGALGDEAATLRHVETGLAVQHLARSAPLRVPARTLSAVIDEARLAQPIDLLSLDIEGGEAAALRGLDFDRHAPRHICVEARDEAAIGAVLEPRYRLVEVLADLGTHRDLFYALR
ncbi:MAG: FkbM family methyltransferase [Opitutaceae bacterium]|nr:FkbM family methyltransferase [Opitutaceae bacterium]